MYCSLPTSGLGVHLGHVTSIMSSDFHFFAPERFHTNLIQIGPLISEKTGLPRVREKSGKLKFFQGQGIVREFCKLSGKFGNTVKCQGIVREF